MCCLLKSSLVPFSIMFSIDCTTHSNNGYPSRVLFDDLGPSGCNAGIGSLKHEVPVTMVSMSNEKIFVTSFWLTLEK